jgi:hypothetical protein
VEAPSGFEPLIELLQSSALPLGHGAAEIKKDRAKAPSENYNIPHERVSRFAKRGCLTYNRVAKIATPVQNQRWQLEGLMPK